MPPSSNERPTKLRIFTLNCWGLKYIAKFRHERLSQIGEEIAVLDPPPDIVGLQECWTQQDYNAIKARVSHILPYGKFYHSGIFGGGLVILSRWPLIESIMYRYPLNGRPAAFYRGDWFVGKGVACARTKFGPAATDIAEIFCTHLHAPYESEPHDSYLCHRTAQAWEIAKLMRHAAERGHLVIGLGDFNMRPKSLAHRLIEGHSPVKDVWRIIHPDSSLGSAVDMVEKKRGKPIPSAEFNLKENGATCDSVLNTWRWNKGQQRDLEKGLEMQVNLNTEDPKAKRLDYIFFANGKGAQVADIPSERHSAGWMVEDVKVGMTQRHPKLRCSLSDHFSVEATLSLQPPGSDQYIPGIPETEGNYLQAEDKTNALTVTPSSQQTDYLPVAVYDEILEMIRVYGARERRQRRFRLTHFGTEIVISVGCFVAIWWSPTNYVSFILILLSTFGLSAGVIDGLMGGLFVGSEIRALKEFDWEVRNTRDAAIAALERGS